MISEQFIQDAICHPARIKRILNDLGRNEWEFRGTPVAGSPETKSIDVINQEVSFNNRRIDVFATFNNRSRLVIVEVKAGPASKESLDQLYDYLDCWRTMTVEELGLAKVKDADVVGLLLAEQFVNIPELRPNAVLVGFKLEAGKWPFRIVLPQETMSAKIVEELPVRSAKQSELYSLVADHANYIQPEKVRQAFLDIAHCFVASSDERSDWIIQNPKGQHVAVHYKGEYLLHLWAKRGRFAVGYKLEGKDHAHEFDANHLDLNQIRSDIERLLGQVDVQMRSLIPEGFSWRKGL